MTIKEITNSSFIASLIFIIIGTIGWLLFEPIYKEILPPKTSCSIIDFYLLNCTNASTRLIIAAYVLLAISALLPIINFSGHGRVIITKLIALLSAKNQERENKND